MLLPVLLLSCYSYSTIRVASKVPCVPVELQRRYSPPQSRVLPKDTSSPDTTQSIHEKQGRCHSVTVKKYLARISSGEPAARINNRGVALALQGQLKEAAILFEEVLGENKNACAALNNLGVLYEMSGKRDKAFELYSRACLLEPDNEYFRHNFLYMVRTEKTLEDEMKKNEGMTGGSNSFDTVQDTQ